MRFILTILSPAPYLELPRDLIGWLGWLLTLLLVACLVWIWRGYNRPWKRSDRLIFLALLLATPLSSLFLGLETPAGSLMAPPGIPVDPVKPVAMVFSALPWTLAAGLFGPFPTALLGLLSGLVQAFWGSHNPFTILEVALFAILFSAAVRQRYRTFAYRAIRHPLVTAALLTIAYPLVVMIDSPLILRGELLSGLTYTLARLPAVTTAVGIELLASGLTTEAVASTFRSRWGAAGPYLPSPAERSLQARFLYRMAPFAFALMVALMIGDWFVAGNAARNLFRDRMKEAAETTADGIPYYVEVGQNLIARMASNPALLTATPGQLATLLQYDLRQVPFFRQLYVLDAKGAPVSGYPESVHPGSQAPLDEQMGVQMALSASVPVQYYAIPPEPGDTAAQVSFVASILDVSGQVRGVLVGRSDLATNPFTQPFLANLQKVSGLDGQGVLLDEHGRILYHPDTTQLMAPYTGLGGNETVFGEETGPDGNKRLVYFQRAQGQPWSVVIIVPSRHAEQLALEIATPLLAIILMLSLLSIVVLHFGLRIVSGSLKNLSFEAGRISQGQLDHPLPVDGEDEISRLRRSFEQMRLSLKARLDELNQLLQVSQGVASTLEISEAVQPVLEAALATGACSARIVLTPSVVPDLDGNSNEPVAFGMGAASDSFAHMDEQILGITRQQGKVVLSHLSRPRQLSPKLGAARPDALMAVSLHHENLYFGALWIAFDQVHSFSEEEVRFVSTLAGQAALATANARLFLNAEIGRQRLAAILSSNPDPVLVTDQSNCLLLANPAAAQVLGIIPGRDEGLPIERLIQQADLVNLLGDSSQSQSAEINLTGGRIFLATASSVLAEGRQVGRVCVLRDFTHFKELNDLKSEFVATVSHDLRSPLTLMRGYATMLEMVGDLNEQQNGYVSKIIIGVESMSRLITNLLDLGRIEAGVGLQLEMVNICDVIERVLGTVQGDAIQKKVQVSTDFSRQALPMVEADPAMLQQALQNLVNNAVKYNRPGGTATVRAAVRQDRLIIAVNDTGIGISPMDQQHMFEKFYRGGQIGSKDHRGTGLGLAIVKSIAERHGGRVWMESQLGKGSTFYLAIPLRQPKRGQASEKQ